MHDRTERSYILLLSITDSLAQLVLPGCLSYCCLLRELTPGLVFLSLSCSGGVLVNGRVTCCTRTCHYFFVPSGTVNMNYDFKKWNLSFLYICIRLLSSLPQKHHQSCARVPANQLRTSGGPRSHVAVLSSHVIIDVAFLVLPLSWVSI